MDLVFGILFSTFLVLYFTFNLVILILLCGSIGNTCRSCSTHYRTAMFISHCLAHIDPFNRYSESPSHPYASMHRYLRPIPNPGNYHRYRQCVEIQYPPDIVISNSISNDYLPFHEQHDLPKTNSSNDLWRAEPRFLPPCSLLAHERSPIGDHQIRPVHKIDDDDDDAMP